jgi:hypothetical protein
VTFIGKAAEPVSIGGSEQSLQFRWAMGDSTAKVSDESDKPFSIQCFQHGLLQILDDPVQEAYRFSMEIRHEEGSNAPPLVGIYFAYSNFRIPQGQVHCFCRVAFNDLIMNVAENPLAKEHEKNKLMMQLELHSESGELLAGHILGSHEFTPTIALGPGVRHWRSLALEVTLENIGVFWEGDRVIVVPCAELLKAARTMLNRLNPGVQAVNDIQLRFGPRAGLGFYVYQASASIQWVRIGPLTEDRPKLGSGGNW